MPLGNEEWAPLPSNEVLRENNLVLVVVQALCGMMTSNIRGVAVEATSDSTGIVYFALKEDSSEDREEIEDFVSECAALDWDLEITTDVWVGNRVEERWPGLGKRFVYSAKDD